MIDLEMKGIILDEIRADMTDIKMRSVILGNQRMNKENITLETKVHQTTTTDRRNSNYRGSSENRNGSTS